MIYERVAIMLISTSKMDRENLGSCFVNMSFLHKSIHTHFQRNRHVYVKLWILGAFSFCNVKNERKQLVKLSGI